MFCLKKVYDTICYTQIADRLKHKLSLSYVRILQQFQLGKAPVDEHHCQKCGKEETNMNQEDWVGCDKCWRCMVALSVCWSFTASL